MALKVPVVVALFLILSSLGCLADEDYVNPLDILNFDPVNIQMTNKVQETVELNKEHMVTENDNLIENQSSINESTLKNETDVKMQKHCPTMKDEALKSLFKRYLMSLVQHIQSRIDSTSVPVEFCMKMKVTYDDMMLLKLYGTGHIDDVHMVHERLEKMVLYPTELPEESPIYWLERKLGLSSPVLMKVIASLWLVIIAAKMLISVRITRSLVTKGIVLAFIMSSAVTYIELYQQKVADKEKILSEDFAERCPLRSQSAYSRIIGFFTSTFTFENEHCREYYEALVVDPFFKVSFLEAGAVTITKTVVAPMKILGHGFKDLLVGLFKDLPSQFSLILFPALLVILIIFPFMVFGYTLKIPFVLTLCPPSAPQQCIPPPEAKRIHCINCMDNRKDQVKEVEDNSSTFPTATPTAIASVFSAHDMDDEQVTKSSAAEKKIFTLDGDAGDQIQEIGIKLKNYKISPVLKEADPSIKAQGKSEEDLQVKDEKECNFRPDGLASTIENVMLSDASVISAACVTDSNTNTNTLSNSNFFLDHKLRPGDKPTENGPSLFPSENDLLGDLQNYNKNNSNDRDGDEMIISKNSCLVEE